jgi:hypothetical protein
MRLASGTAVWTPEQIREWFKGPGSALEHGWRAEPQHEPKKPWLDPPAPQKPRAPKCERRARRKRLGKRRRIR